MEEWKDIKGYEGIYQISNHGNVKSLRRVIKYPNYNKVVEEKILSQNKTNGNGYIVSALSKNGKSKNKYVHILVAEHFIENDLNKPTVNHKDGNKKNNHVSNLEWATQQEQMKHAYDNNLNIPPDPSIYKTFGEKCCQSKLKEYEIIQIYDLAINKIFSQEYIGSLYGVSRRNVGNIKNKEIWKHLTQNFN